MKISEFTVSQLISSQSSDAILILTHKAPPIICSSQQIKILLLFQNNK